MADTNIAMTIRQTEQKPATFVSVINYALPFKLSKHELRTMFETFFGAASFNNRFCKFNLKAGSD